MTPVIQDKGQSFRGAARYYLHDKQALTAARVEWTATHNLRTDDPDKAWRIMAFTAMAREDIKADAGVKKGGRKATSGPVFTYCLSWHPTETPTREHQLESAMETLKLLGFEKHQALIVAHNDTAHPHVHVIVNCTDPDTGKLYEPSFGMKKLQKWARKYEKDRGQNFSPKREENAQKREQGEKTSHKRKERKEYEAEQAAAQNGGLTYDFVLAEQKVQDARLKHRGRAMDESHKRQWRQLSALYRAEKAQLAGVRDDSMTKAQNAAREQHGHQWAALRLRQDADRLAFRRREGSFIGFVANTLRTVRELRQQEREAGREDPATFAALTLFVAALSSAERRSTLDRSHRREKAALRQQQKAELDGIAWRHWKDHLAREAGLHSAFAAQFDALKARQKEDRAAIRAAWRERKAEYAKAMLPFRDRDAARAKLRERTQQRGRGIERTRELTRKPPPPKPGQP